MEWIQTNWISSLPHARGGVSNANRSIVYVFLSSPCTWGCFPRETARHISQCVFPMHVGVFLQKTYAAFCIKSLPHARGGVSCISVIASSTLWSSPCTWGCFYLGQVFDLSTYVFPMHVGVFPVHQDIRTLKVRLPHARGGVSYSNTTSKHLTQSSPCTWGCFHLPFNRSLVKRVFPMHVGVFLLLVMGVLILNRLPHARGGVS